MDDTELTDLTLVGPKKPMGYLPLPRIVIAGADPKVLEASLRDRGLETRWYEETDSSKMGPGQSTTSGGALYAFDNKALQAVLDKNLVVLNKYGWPIESSAFVEKVANYTAEPPELWNVVAKAFGNPDRLDAGGNLVNYYSPLRVGIVDDGNIYISDMITPPLVEALTRGHHMDVKCYVPRARKDQKQAGQNVAASALRFVWSSFDFPFTIAWAMLRDKRQVAFIELEQSTFGSPITLPLVVLLYALLRVQGIKIVTNLQGLVPLHEFSKSMHILAPRSRMPVAVTKWMSIRIYRRLFKLSNQIQVYSPTLAETVAEYWSQATTRMVFVSLGVRQKPGNVPIQFLIGGLPEALEGKTYFLALGHIVPRKGLEYLVKAWRVVANKFPRAVLLIAGSTTRMPEHTRDLRHLLYLTSLLQNVFIVGDVTYDQMQSYIEGAKALVFPYIYSDSASGPLLYAMEHRKPVLVSDIGLFHDLFPNEFCGGVKVPPGDAEALAAAIIRMIEDGALMDELQKGMKEHAYCKNWNEVGSQYARLLMDVIAA